MAPHQYRYLIVALTIAWLSIVGATNKVSTAQEPYDTLWYGKMRAGEREFRFVVEANSKTSPQKGSLLSLDEGSRKFDLLDFFLDENKLSFKVNSAIFEGHRVENELVPTYKGLWKQSGAQFELELRQTDKIPSDDAVEVWRGTLKAGFQKLEMQVRSYRKSDGDLEYFVDSLNEKQGGFRATGGWKESELTLEVPTLKSKYSGKLSEDKKSIRGKWTQGLTFELNLERVEQATTKGKEVRRPQNPVPPFLYSSREVLIPAKAGTIKLSGTLTVPNGKKKYPLAILISGSGPQDRDETIFDHKPFWVLADFLTRQGMAVLRYDERGVGKSNGSFETATTEDFTNDVRDIVSFARQEPEIDPAQIGLIGHSEGGIIAPMVASQDRQIAWLILLAATGVNGEQILYSQARLLAEAEGANPSAIDQHRKLQELAFSVIRTVDPNENIDSLIDSRMADFLRELKPDGTELSPDQEKSIREGVKISLTQLHHPWFRFFLNHEPGPFIEKVSCPVLVLNGSKDLQVDSKLNLPAIESGLKKGGNLRYKIREIPGVNHLFQTCQSGSISEYAKIEETISPVVLMEIIEWLQEQAVVKN